MTHELMIFLAGAGTGASCAFLYLCVLAKCTGQPLWRQDEWEQ